MDSQHEEVGAAKSDELSETSLLGFDEFLECIARCGVEKYRAVQAMSPADAVKGMIQNLISEATRGGGRGHDLH